MIYPQYYAAIKRVSGEIFKNWRLTYVYYYVWFRYAKKYVSTYKNCYTEILNRGWLWRGNWNCEGMWEGGPLNSLVHLPCFMSVACESLSARFSAFSFMSSKIGYYDRVWKLGPFLLLSSFLLLSTTVNWFPSIHHGWPMKVFWVILWTLGFKHISCVSIHCVYYHSDAQIVFSLATISLFKLAPEFLCSSYNLIALLISGMTKCFKSLFYISCPRLGINCFSKELWFLLMGN